MQRCAHCDKAIRRGWSFQLGSETRCTRCMLLRWPLLKRSLLTAMVVGTFLSAVNQGATIAGGKATLSLAWKVALTYTAPFLVATWSALINSKAETPR